MSAIDQNSPTTCCCIVVVKESTIGILERFGRFVRTVSPGISCIVPCADSAGGYVSTRTQQLRLTVETKTFDSVFVKIIVAVQYKIEAKNAKLAHYSLTNPTLQIASFVENIIRSQVAEIEMDALFTSKDEIAHAVLDAIDDRMREYGYDILETLVTDIEPDPAVKRAMNQIQEAKRTQAAAEHKGEADKIIRIKEAEARKAATILDAQADAEAKRLAGVGMAAQREAIVNGLRESVSNFAESVGVDSQEAMNYVILTQHYDTLKDVANYSNTATLFTPYGPGAVADLSSQIRDSFLQAKMVPAPMDMKKTKKPKKDGSSD